MSNNSHKQEEGCESKCLSHQGATFYDGKPHDCPCHTPTEETESWEKRFDENFPTITLTDLSELEAVAAKLRDYKTDIKSFIRTEKALSHQQGREEILNQLEKETQKTPDHFNWPASNPTHMHCACSSTFKARVTEIISRLRT